MRFTSPTTITSSLDPKMAEEISGLSTRTRRTILYQVNVSPPETPHPTPESKAFASAWRDLPSDIRDLVFKNTMVGHIEDDILLAFQGLPIIRQIDEKLHARIISEIDPDPTGHYYTDESLVKMNKSTLQTVANDLLPGCHVCKNSTNEAIRAAIKEVQQELRKRDDTSGLLSQTLRRIEVAVKYHSPILRPMVESFKAEFPPAMIDEIFFAPKELVKKARESVPEFDQLFSSAA